MPEESKLAEKLEKQQKFTEEEVNKIKEIQTEYLKIQNLFGQLSISEMRLLEQLSLLEKSKEENKTAFVKVQIKEKDLIDEFTKKYGEGNLNPETGEFTPNKS